MIERIKVQIQSAIGMRRDNEARLDRFIALMRAECAPEVLEDMTDEKLRRLARSCHGIFLAAEVRAQRGLK